MSLFGGSVHQSDGVFIKVHFSSLQTGTRTVEPSDRHEPRRPKRDQVSHACQWRPCHATQGPPQVQATADSSVQEQAPEEGDPGVKAHGCL